MNLTTDDKVKLLTLVSVQKRILLKKCVTKMDLVDKATWAHLDQLDDKLSVELRDSIKPSHTDRSLPFGAPEETPFSMGKVKRSNHSEYREIKVSYDCYTYLEEARGNTDNATHSEIILHQADLTDRLFKQVLRLRRQLEETGA